MVRFAEENTPLFIEPHYKPKRKMSTELKEKLRNTHLGKRNIALFKKVYSVSVVDGTIKHFDNITDGAVDVFPNDKNKAYLLAKLIGRCAKQNGNGEGKHVTNGRMWYYE